jgi:hypothetical protein
MQGEKVPERSSSLLPYEKELPERRPGAFHHKNYSAYMYYNEQ